MAERRRNDTEMTQEDSTAERYFHRLYAIEMKTGNAFNRMYCLFTLFIFGK